jgi:uncharacterized protein
VRLTPYEIKSIKACVKKVLGPDATVSLFGSRTDDTKSGGDIDLLVQSLFAIDNPAMTAARIEAEIIMTLGDQKIDVLLKAPNLAIQPIHQIAEQGILL